MSTPILIQSTSWSAAANTSVAGTAGSGGVNGYASNYTALAGGTGTGNGANTDALGANAHIVSGTVKLELVGTTTRAPNNAYDWIAGMVLRPSSENKPNQRSVISFVAAAGIAPAAYARVNYAANSCYVANFEETLQRFYQLYQVHFKRDLRSELLFELCP